MNYPGWPPAFSRTRLSNLARSITARSWTPSPILRTPPTRAELRTLVAKLGIAPEQLVRKGEDVYQEKFKGRILTDEQWLDALAANPILIERPIVVKGDRAVVGRPPERVLEVV
jgi:arsenate reductase